MVVIKAGEEKYIKFNLPETDKAGEYAVNVSFKLKKDTLWAKKGYTIAFDQCVYSIEGENVPKKLNKLKVIHGDVNIGVKNKDFSVLFSKQEGGIISLRYQGREMITRAPMPIYWRAMTDNDKGNGQGFRCGQWLQASMFQKCIDVNVKEDDYSIAVEYTYLLPTTPQCTVKVKYTAYENGEIKVCRDYKGVQKLPEMPIFGIALYSCNYSSKANGSWRR